MSSMGAGSGKTEPRKTEPRKTEPRKTEPRKTEPRIERMDAVRVGVIGAGVMGSNHARVLAGLPGVRLVGVVDPLPAHRTRATELAGCRTFTNLDELLAEG